MFNPTISDYISILYRFLYPISKVAHISAQFLAQVQKFFFQTDAFQFRIDKKFANYPLVPGQ